MTRTHTAARIIPAPREACWGAWLDAETLPLWLPPEGMTAEVTRFEPREGGTFRIVLTRIDGPSNDAKSTPDSDVLEAVFIRLDRPRELVFESGFESDRPEFAGRMRMAWRFETADGGTLAQVIAENVPEGIPQDVHEAGLAMSLANLSAFLAGQAASA